MKTKTCCFIGHRKIPSEQYECIAERLKSEVINLIKKGYIYFGAGGALGFDTLAAQTVLSLKEKYPQIKLILVLPCPQQTNNWDNQDIIIYNDIKNKCDKFVYTSQEYSRGCMFKRNRHLVDNSSFCISYLTNNKSGTAYTVNYVKLKGLQIINIDVYFFVLILISNKNHYKTCLFSVMLR